jgi:hypothetical protein
LLVVFLWNALLLTSFCCSLWCSMHVHWILKDVVWILPWFSQRCSSHMLIPLLLGNAVLPCVFQITIYQIHKAKITWLLFMLHEIWHNYFYYYNINSLRFQIQAKNNFTDSLCFPYWKVVFCLYLKSEGVFFNLSSFFNLTYTNFSSHKPLYLSLPNTATSMIDHH